MQVVFFNKLRNRSPCVAHFFVDLEFAAKLAFLFDVNG